MKKKRKSARDVPCNTSFHLQRDPLLESLPEHFWNELNLPITSPSKAAVFPHDRGSASWSSAVGPLTGNLSYGCLKSPPFDQYRGDRKIAIKKRKSL